MKINRIYGRINARKARGLVVVIDILRAATVEAFALSKGAQEIIPVSELEDAFRLKKDNPRYLLVGENDGLKVEGFDLGNSPSEILKVNLEDKILIHRTSAGTRALWESKNAQELVFGSFVTASATIKLIKSRNPREVSLVALANDDSLCADYLNNLLTNRKTDIKLIKNKLYNMPETEWFRDPKKKAFPLEDLDLAFDIDRFSFACQVIRTDQGLSTRRVNV